MLEPSNFVKIAAAFVGGVIVALGSALVYVRMSDVEHSPPIAQVAPPIARPAAADPPRSVTPAPEPADPAANAVPAAVRDAAPPPVRRHKEKVRKALPRPEPPPAPDPVSSVQDVALNAPPPAAPVPAPVQVPGRAVNEDQYQGPQPTAEAQANPVPPPSPQPHVVTLAAGTNVFIRLGETLSSEENYTGDTFRGTLEQPIVLDGFIIADRGSKVLGQIVNAQRAGRIQGVSDLSLRLTEINTTDGQQVRIITDTFDKQGNRSRGEDAAKVAGGAALGAIIGALGGGGKGAAIGAGVGGAAGTGAVLATRGKTAMIPAETKLQFRLANPVTITEKLNN